MAEVGWEPKYNINSEDLDYTDIFHLRDALVEKGAKLLSQAPNIFGQIIVICDHILKLDEQD